MKFQTWKYSLPKCLQKHKATGISETGWKVNSKLNFVATKTRTNSRKFPEVQQKLNLKGYKNIVGYFGDSFNDLSKF